MPPMVQKEFYEHRWQSLGSTLNGEQRLRAGRICQIIETYVTKDEHKLSILDMGCGNGWLANILQEYGSVTGADFFSESFFRETASKFPTLDFISLDETKKDLGISPNMFFDLIVCSEVIEHVPYSSQQGFLKLLFSHLHDNSWLVLTTPNGRYKHEWERVMKKRNYQFQPTEDWLRAEDLAALILGAGFKLILHSTMYSHFTWKGIHGILRLRGIGRLLSLIGIDWGKFRDRFGLYQIVLAVR